VLQLGNIDAESLPLSIAAGKVATQCARSSVVL